MKNLKKLILIFERDFINQENNIEVCDIDFKILNQNLETITTNTKLAVLYSDDTFGTFEIDESVYEMKYLKMISEMKKYKKEIEENL